MIDYSKQRCGEEHGAAKLTDADVALARLIAREANLPRPWVLDLANYFGVTDGALCAAIGGQSWAHITSPAPVPAYSRHKTGGVRGDLPRPVCPVCGGRKYDGDARGCRARFHTIDHRQFSSPINARKARAAPLARGNNGK